MALVDNFDSYTDGDLNTQGGWADDAGSGFTVQGTTVKAGAKAIAHTAATASGCIKTITSVTTGGQVCHMRQASNNEALTAIEVQQVAGTFAYIFVIFDDSGQIQYYNGASYQNIQAYSANTWYKLEVEWRSSDSKARYRVDDGTWTAWDSIASGTIVDGMDRVRIKKQNAIGTACYWDEFSAPAQAFTQTQTEALILVDTISRTSGLRQLISDIITLVDTGVTTVYLMGISLVETITLIDIKTIQTNFRKTINEIITLVDTGVTAGLKFFATLTETISLNDIIRIPKTWWTWITKHTTSWTHQSKNTTSWTHQSKNSSSWTWQNKSDS